jgi:hypothetical protein
MPRWYESPVWRFVVTDLDTAIVTMLDRVASDRSVVYALNKPAQAVGQVPSDNPEVNIPHTDGDPFLSEGNRLLYGFRREAGGSIPPWVVRYGGLILQVQDEAGSGQPVTHYTAFDPWQYLYSRPVLRDDGELPGSAGVTFTGMTGDAIVTDLLLATVTAHGEAFIDFGQTGFYTGTIETTPVIPEINFQQGTSVGEAWDQVVATANLDIILSAIYDPVNRPGFVSELNVYAQAGQIQNEAIFAWDLPSRSLVGVDRLMDGSKRVNKLRPFAGQGQTPRPLQTNAASVAKYREYWEQKFYSEQIVGPVADVLASVELAAKAQGKQTITINPAPELCPLPFTEFFLGDLVPVYASNRLRAPIGVDMSATPPTGYQRVYAIPLNISDNAYETVDRLLLSEEESG